MNVIVIMEDSFRKDHLGCYGNTWIKTPNLDKFASESVIFDFAYVEGAPTIPSRIALFTGRYTLPFRGWQPIEQHDLPIAELLWDKGIRSSIVSDTYHMHKAQMGFSRGFDHVEWIRGQEADPAVVDSTIDINLSEYSEKNWHPSYPGEPERLVKKQFKQYLKNRANWRSEKDHHIARVISSSISWLENQLHEGRNDNLFLWIDSFDPHEPWDAPTDYLDMYPVKEYNGLPITWGGGFVDDWEIEEIRHVRAQYAATITMVDKWSGILFKKIDDLGLLENTMIIFITDHGEPLGEHGIIKKVQPWPYDELSRIPLIIRLPDSIQEKKRLASFVSMPDIAPTILGFFGINVPTVMQGEDLMPLVKGQDEGRKTMISGYHGRSQSIRNQKYSFFKWIGVQMGSKARVEPEFYEYNANYVPPKPNSYNLGDQAEKLNLTNQKMEEEKLLQEEMSRFINSMKPSPGDLMSKEYMKRQMRFRGGY